MSKNNNAKKNSCIIYLIGQPGIGKYTIAQELAISGFIVCDNHLINNPIFTLLNYDSFSKIPEIGWNAIGRIRTTVLDFISTEQCHNYVLTNCLYEDEGDHNCYSQVKSMALKRGSLFFPVKLLISEEDNLLLRELKYRVVSFLYNTGRLGRKILHCLAPQLKNAIQLNRLLDFYLKQDIAYFRLLSLQERLGV